MSVLRFNQGVTIISKGKQFNFEYEPITVFRHKQREITYLKKVLLQKQMKKNYGN